MPVTPAELRAMLLDYAELALIDVREELIFSQAHLLHARSIPLSRLELRIGRMVPRRGTRIILCDGGEGLAERAAAVLARGGYEDIAILAGGIAAWKDAGFEIFSGVNVPSKAFGELVEYSHGTPHISAEELDRLQRGGLDLVVLDSRPFDEYSRVSIPGATSVPGAELVLRVRDLAPAPETLVVVNCAGRTRSIIGAQSLINAGVPNKVVALRNGTMGWTLAGLRCDSGKQRRAPDVSDEAVAWAREAAGRVGERFAVSHIDLATLDRWQNEIDDRTLYVFDVRDPSEYAAGHVPGAVSAPGGQLVQATDQYVGTLHARIVLVDDREVRAVMTASWLRQMGWTDVHVLVAAGGETGVPLAPVLNADPQPGRRIETAVLAALMSQGDATVIDLSLSRDYRAQHIPGAWFAIRSRLDRALSIIPITGMLVLTSEDGVLAALAAPEAAALTDAQVRYLAGGNVAWREAGYELTPDEPRMADEPVDIWLKPYERPGSPQDAVQDYLTWEVDLVAAVARDGTARFALDREPAIPPP